MDTEPSEPEPSGTGWRFLAFAAVVLVGVPLLVINAPQVVNNIRYRIDERQYERSIEPARLAVARMQAPSGSLSCDYRQSDLAAWGQFCWQQQGDASRAMTELLAALRAVGGKVVEKHCVADPAGGSACLLYAEVDGTPFTANIFRPPRPDGRARATLIRVTGGLDVATDHPHLFERTLPGDGRLPPSAGWWGWEAPPTPDLPMPSSSP